MLNSVLEKRKRVRRLEHFEALLQRQSRDPQLLLRHAEAALAAEQPDRALASYRAAASLYRTMGSWARAQVVLKRAVEMAPGDVLLRQELEQVVAARRAPVRPNLLAMAKKEPVPAPPLPTPVRREAPKTSSTLEQRTLRPVAEAPAAWVADAPPEKTEVIQLTQVVAAPPSVADADMPTLTARLSQLISDTLEALDDPSGGFRLATSLPEGFDTDEIPEVLTSDHILPAAEPHAPARSQRMPRIILVKRARTSPRSP